MKTKVFLMTLLLSVGLALALVSVSEADETKSKRYAAEVDGVRMEYTLERNGCATIVDAYTDFCAKKVVRVPDEIDGHKVVALGDYAFRYFDSVYSCEAERVYIPMSVTRIGANPFGNWYTLKKIVVDPDHPRFEVVDGALYDKIERRLIACPLALEGTFRVQEGTKIIGELAFGGNDLWGSWGSQLTAVVLPDSVEEIRYGAFELSRITEIRLPQSLRIIGEEAFYYSALKEVKFNHRLQYVGKFAFRYTDLSEVDLPDSIEYISVDAFANCEDLTAVNASPRVTAMLTVHPEDCYTWEVDADGNATITGVVMLPDKDVVTIPDALDSHPVTGIADYAFRDAEGNDVNWYYHIKTVFIPAGVTEIGLNPFVRCQYIFEEIAVDPANPRYESVDGILYDKQTKTLISYPIAAANWPNRDDRFVTVKEGTLAIAPSAFGCEGEEYSFVFVNDADLYITLPESLKEISASAFENCNIGSINIPSGVERIPDRAFYHGRVESITLSEGLREIGYQAFYRAHIDEIRFPLSLESIGDEAFYSSWLREVAFNEGLQSIGSAAFYDNWHLKVVDLPLSLETVAPDAFERCDRLETMTGSEEILKALGRS